MDKVINIGKRMNAPGTGPLQRSSTGCAYRMPCVGLRAAGEQTQHEFWQTAGQSLLLLQRS